MGILNLTPDSFFDGGRYENQQEVLSRADLLISQGADILDLGAYSSRPGAKHVSEEEELKRLVPALELIHSKYPKAIISVDTFRSKVAEKAVEKGASIINDISAGSLDPLMFDTVAEMQVPYIAMHMQGRPENMQDNPEYKNITEELLYYFSEIRNQLFQLGLNDLIIDPGFGFGKTLEHNYQILAELDVFQHLDLPMLIGLSRKSMLYKPLNIPPQEALNATTAAHMMALNKGAQILRVHDVKEAKQAITIFELTHEQA